MIRNDRHSTSAQSFYLCWHSGWVDVPDLGQKQTSGRPFVHLVGASDKRVGDFETELSVLPQIKSARIDVAARQGRPTKFLSW
jgi:hypothetical protein